MRRVFSVSRSKYPILSNREALRLVAIRPQMPNVAQALEELYENENSQRFGRPFGRQAYVAMFEFLHSAAHGSLSLSLFTREEGEHWNIHAYLFFSMLLLIEAVYRRHSWPMDRNARSAMQSFRRMAQHDGAARPKKRQP